MIKLKSIWYMLFTPLVLFGPMTPLTVVNFSYAETLSFFPGLAFAAKPNVLEVRQDDAAQDEAAIDPEKLKLAGQAGKILNDYCFRCHRGEGSAAGGYAFNARDISSMIDEGTLSSGSADDSDIYHAMFRNRMPPKNQIGLPRPTPEETDIIRRWIEAGAPAFPPLERREFIGLKQVMESIFKHYQGLDPQERGSVRFFTLTNLWNDPNVEQRHLRMARAALAKALNSLSWEPELVVPVAVDANQMIFAVDISRLGWTSQHWRALLEDYPYEIDVDAIVDDGSGEGVTRLRRIEEDLIRLSGGDRTLKHMRADWFVTIGLRPKLYHRLLYDLSLPALKSRSAKANDPANPKSMTDRDLEDFLGVNVVENIFGRRVNVHRAGFTESGISGQNRMIERHPLPSRGYYWKSYDFLGSNSRATLTEFPLGPQRGPNDDFSFLHDGGEIIFSLPNGLQGYLLSTAHGGRLDAGPIEIVGDALKTSGNQVIVNGLSCVVCHRKGMVDPPDDNVRANAGTFGADAERVRQLYPEKERMQALLAADARSFQQSLEPLLKKFLTTDDFKSFDDGFPLEPVGEVARWYLLQPMNLEMIAAELYHSDVATLRLQIQKDPRARRIGLGTLRDENGTIKREAWQNVEGRSLMQLAAEVLGYAPGL